MSPAGGGGPVIGSRPIEDRLAEAGLPPLRRLAWLEIDVSILEANARRLRGLLPPRTRLGIVVKADGYGHGLVGAAVAAAAGGADRLLVATLDEALALRAAGIRLPVLVLYPVPSGAIREAVAADVELSVAGPGSLEGLLRAVGKRGPGGRTKGVVHLAIDTGMTRGGFAPQRALEAVEALVRAPSIHLAGVWSHLASPELPTTVAAQVARFDDTLRELHAAGHRPETHLAATGGLFGTAPPYDLVRIGLAFYGLLPPELQVAPEARDVAAGLRPALTLKARAADVVEVEPGTAVGYGGTWRAGRRSTIATLPLGYADGLARLSSPGASALVGGRRLPIVGRISSDAVAVDVTDVAPLPLDAEFVLLGEQGSERIPAGELASLRRSIPWEVLDTLDDRLARVYLRDGSPVAVLPPGASMAIPSPSEGLMPPRP
jgi:alanine racemase